jgi:hypothetical protein
VKTLIASRRALATAVALLVASAACSASDNGGFDDAGVTPTADGSAPPKPDAGANPDAGRMTDAGAVAPDSAPPIDARAPFDGGAAPDASGSVDAAPDATSYDAASIDAAAPDASAVDGSVADAASSTTLIGAWTFNEGTGTSSADLSGNGHPAVLTGGATWATGKEGTGLALNGTTGYADVGVALVDTTKSFSVVSWANLTIVNAWAVVVSEDDVIGSLFGLKLRGDNSNQFDFDVETSDVMSPGFVVAQATSTAQASTWVHLAGVYDADGAGTMKMYVNGAPEATAAVGHTLLGATGHLVIGRGLYNGATGSFVNGTLDEVAVYAGALSDAQVAAMYAAQK